jgi:hypothetical protein
LPGELLPWGWAVERYLDAPVQNAQIFLVLREGFAISARATRPGGLEAIGVFID